MKALEKRTKEAYDEVSSVRVDIFEREKEHKRLRSRTVIVAALIVPFIVGLFIFAPWFTALAPLVTYFVIGVLVTRHLSWLSNDALPALRRRYVRALTAATNALQAQEERRMLGLSDPEAYAKMEQEAQAELDAEKQKRERELIAEQWDFLFRRAIAQNTNIYG